MQITEKYITSNFTNHRIDNKVNQQVIRCTFHTAVSSSDSLYSYFNNPNTQASSHFYINKYGTIEQYVRYEHTAWTNSNWSANTRSITIETFDNGNPNDSVRTDAMYESCSQLLAFLHNKYPNIEIVFLTKEQALNFSIKGLDKHAYYSSKSCFAGLNIDRIITRTINILNQTPMAIDATIQHDGSNLAGYKLSDSQAQFETNAWATVYGKSYGKWYETFRMNPQCQEFDVGALNQQMTDLKLVVADQKKTISDQLDIIKQKDITIAELNKVIDIKNEEIMNLQSQLTTCLAGNLVPDIKINFFNLFQILIVKNKKK